MMKLCSPEVITGPAVPPTITMRIFCFSLGYYIIPVVILIMYALASLELKAEEIENPSGTDANDLPTDLICHNIRKHVGELLS